MKRSAVHVVRAYEVSVAEVRGAGRDALLARVEEFFAGNTPPYSKFELGDVPRSEPPGRAHGVGKLLKAASPSGCDLSSCR